ncbi:MAG: hypothetical protein WCL51_13160 [Bacteroidota bacterium]|jgi:hypothetical protein
MLNKYIKCKKRPKKGTFLERIEAHRVAAAKQKANTLLVPIAVMMFALIITNATTAEALYNAWKNGDEPSKTAFLNIMAVLDDGYYKNGVYYEVIANETSNNELFVLLGYQPYKIAVNPEKNEISVINTDVKGELEFDLRNYKKVKSFDVQGRIITDGVVGDTKGFPSLTECKGTVAGFESGALYQVRTRPSFTNGKKGEWSPWVEIRIT